MIEKILKITSIFSGILLIVVFSLSLIYSSLNKENIHAREDELKTELEQEESTILIGKNEISDKGSINDSLVIGNTLNKEESLGDKYILLPIQNHATSVELVDLYRNKSIQITITGVHKEDFDPLDMKRINGNNEFNALTLLQSEVVSGSKSIYVTSANSEEGSLPINYEHENNLVTETTNINNQLDPVIELQVEYKNKTLESQDVILTIKLDKIYAPILYMDEEGIYISLKKPKDVYDNIIVIDAGHGGKDSGTYSKGEKYYEKDFNLSIVSMLKETLEKDKIKVYYTRLEDETMYLNPRVNLANEVEADLFLSIHFNASESPSAGGSEVLYNELDMNTSYTSKMFATNCLDEILKVTQKVNRGLVDGNEMIIIGNAKMPVALVEIGFMTNEEELNFFLDNTNREAIVDALHTAISKSFIELNNITK